MCPCIPFLNVWSHKASSLQFPIKPKLAISVTFLEFYTALFEQTGDAVTAIAGAFSNFMTEEGIQWRIKRCVYCECVLTDLGRTNCRSISQIVSGRSAMV